MRNSEIEAQTEKTANRKRQRGRQMEGQPQQGVEETRRGEAKSKSRAEHPGKARAHLSREGPGLEADRLKSSG